MRERQSVSKSGKSGRRIEVSLPFLSVAIGLFWDLLVLAHGV